MENEKLSRANQRRIRSHQTATVVGRLKFRRALLCLSIGKATEQLITRNDRVIHVDKKAILPVTVRVVKPDKARGVARKE